MNDVEPWIEEIVDAINRGEIKDRLSLEHFKAKISRKYSLKRTISNTEIMKHLERPPEFLIKKPRRSLSGVSVVAVMVEPHECPGKCIYCPDSPLAPKSYTGFEPASLRAKRDSFDPFVQVRDRITQLERMGHPTDKIDLIVMGGTFLSMDSDYRRNFIKSCYDGLNGEVSDTLEDSIKRNEHAKHRCIGLTIETRPDFCTKEHIVEMLYYGTTRVELGVQHPDDRIYALVKRGHTVKDVVNATQWLKDSGLKVNYHIMPGLPGSSPKKDLNMFKMLFEDERFKPDMLKIYPCLLVKEEFYKDKTIYEMYRRGGWKPYTDEEATELIATMKQFVPKWVRIMRIQRDIPSQYVEAGVKSTNLRQLVHEKLKERGYSCRCIRCREIGASEIKEVELFEERYRASGGEEIFLSYEDTSQDKLIAFLRLRFPGDVFIDWLENGAFVRELRVYGKVVPIGEKHPHAPQHKGFGRKLLERAEEITKEAGYDYIFVTSGVGVRDYYRRLGYELIKTHMGKRL